MRNSKTAIFIVSCVLFLASSSAAADLKDGFLGYKWGEDISSEKGFEFLYTKNNVSYYSNPDESYKIDDIQVDNVIFGFYNDSLFAVHIGIDTLETYDRIKIHMKSKYGFPDRKTSNNNQLTTFKWKYQGVSIKIKVDDDKGKMKISFYHGPLSRDLEKSQLDEISSTSDQLFPVKKNNWPSLVPLLEF